MSQGDQGGRGRFVIRASVEQLVLAAAVFWLLAGNRPFLAAALQGRPLLSAAGAGFVLALALALVALHALLLGLVAQRHTIRPLLALLTLVTAVATWYGTRYGVVLDPSMLRNVLHTDVAEASELLSLPLLLHLGLYAVLPLVLVVGETARAANWGLASGPRADGRDTTPRLRALPVLDFGAVQACGTNTETSVPCLFAPVGRRDHDEDRIRGQQSLLHVLARAGVAVHWRDNQSGCKGVCDGLPGDRPTAATAPGLCEGDRCLDEALIADLDKRLQRLQRAGGGGTEVWVLHMLGNHGPAYFRRHPAAFTAYTPECRDEDLSRCEPQAIANAYDNALRYTDEVLARSIERLAAHAGAVDSALLYVSDHGESLGEHGLFLHGLPYAIAPDVQRQVPMVFWASGGFEQGAGLRAGCVNGPMRQRAQAGGVAHDHVFHTVLGLLDVQTALHEPALDLVAGCRAENRASR